MIVSMLIAVMVRYSWSRSIVALLRSRHVCPWSLIHFMLMVTFFTTTILTRQTPKQSKPRPSIDTDGGVEGTASLPVPC